ncbi:PTS lactose/cellobiose transporter subunit IIA [uncultured Dubosiella sp.]|uniref:PTS lactose/cellobiose transporter subunit IIA n=1 Tax=uncultured Dubosiella sp. TaxID=1937011 RepID=UPI0027315C55|nr:PTS lactose/cellobiose transporter subunit IIA [uncultured Dubosiella sp.]
MEGLELVSFQIIASVGAAKSMYMESMQAAQRYDFDKAEQLIEEAEEMFLKGHEAHANLIQQEASGKAVNPTLLLMHAEDQLMACETSKQIALQQILMCKKFQLLEK